MLATPVLAVAGCGGGQDLQVIQPGEPYRPTAQEQEMLDSIELVSDDE
ncbi:MAG: hypothetical protein AAGA03_17360 [Planctomycetota bacterium]